MKKWLGLIIIVVLIIVAVGGYLLYRMMTTSMYEVGNVRKGINVTSSLTPVEQETGKKGQWQVEENIFLNYFSEGEGQKVLIVHGGPAVPYIESWPGLSKLTDRYQFYYYDQRGSGESTRPITSFESNNFYKNSVELEEKLGLTAQIADIERIRQIIGEEKLIIIGHSYGGLLATLYAAEFPENVESLVLVAPAATLEMPSKLPGLFDSIEKELSGQELEDYKAFMKGYFNFKDMFSKDDAYYIKQNEKLSKYYFSALKNYNLASPSFGKPGGWSGQAVFMSGGMRYNYIEQIGELDIPTLIVHTGNDFVQVEEASRQYMNIFTKADFLVLEGAGHFGFYDKPNKFGEMVGSFLDKINN